MTWAWLFAWAKDPVVWDWIRTITAGLIGALIGGFFSLRGQRIAAEAAAKQQREQFEAETKAATARWDRERYAAARAQSLDSARALARLFQALLRSINDTPISKRALKGWELWEGWDSIWTSQLSLDLNGAAQVIVDDQTRGVLQRILHALDKAETLTAGYNPERIQPDPKSLAYQLASDGLEVVSSYIRDSKPSEERIAFLTSLEVALKAYEDFQQWSFERSVDFYERYERDPSMIPVEDTGGSASDSPGGDA